jgi:hypothetical protein
MYSGAPPVPLLSACAALQREFPFLDAPRAYRPEQDTWNAADGYAWVLLGRLQPEVDAPHPLLSVVTVKLPSQLARLGSDDVTAAAAAPDAEAPPEWTVAIELAGAQVRQQETRPWLGYDGSTGEAPLALRTQLRRLARTFGSEQVLALLVSDDADADGMAEAAAERARTLLALLKRLGALRAEYFDGRGFERQRCCMCTAQTATGLCTTCRARVLCADCFLTLKRELAAHGHDMCCPRCVYLKVNATNTYSCSLPAIKASAWL